MRFSGNLFCGRVGTPASSPAHHRSTLPLGVPRRHRGAVPRAWQRFANRTNEPPENSTHGVSWGAVGTHTPERVVLPFREPRVRTAPDDVERHAVALGARQSRFSFVDPVLAPICCVTGRGSRCARGPPCRGFDPETGATGPGLRPGRRTLRRCQIGRFYRLQRCKGTRINIVDIPPYVESQSLAPKTAIAALQSEGSNTGTRCRCTCRYASSRHLSTHPRTVFAQTPHGVRRTRTIPRPCRARRCTTGNTSLYRHTGDPGDPTSCQPTAPPTART